MNGYIANREEHRNIDIRLLFVGDPNLGVQGFEIVHRHFAHATCSIWRRGDGAHARTIKEILRSRPWNVLVSFYNDLLFSEADLTQAEIALNIHPASPCLRGVGYDILPLIFGHTTHGVTLHHMVPEPDAGSIIDVIEEPLPPDLAPGELRLRNQRLCLRMLEKFVRAIQDSTTPSEIRTVLKTSAKNVKAQWSSDYFSRARLNAILDDAQSRQPEILDERKRPSVAAQ